MASNVLCNYWFIYLLILLVYTPGIASSDYERETNAHERALGVGNWEQSALPKGESVFVIFFSPTSFQLWKEKKAFSFVAKWNLWIFRIVSISLHFYVVRVEPPLTATSLQWPLFCPDGQSIHWLWFKPLYNGHLSTTATATKACPQLPK